MKLWRATLLFLFLISVLTPLASADLGPKPEATITVSLDSKPIQEVFWAKMLECQQVKDDEWVQKSDWIMHSFGGCAQDQIDKGACEKLRGIVLKNPSRDCYWLYVPTAWGGNCTESKCVFTYFLPSEFRLALQISNKTFVTNAVSRDAMLNNYHVELYANGTALIEKIALVENHTYFFIGAGLTILLELIGALVFVSIKKMSRTFLLVVLLANVVSLPLVWFVFPSLSLSAALIILVSEIAVVFLEAGIYLLNNLWSKKKLVFWQALLLSLILNAVSFFAGGLLMYGRLF